MSKFIIDDWKLKARTVVKLLVSLSVKGDIVICFNILFSCHKCFSVQLICTLLTAMDKGINDGIWTFCSAPLLLLRVKSKQRELSFLWNFRSKNFRSLELLYLCNFCSLRTNIARTFTANVKRRSKSIAINIWGQLTKKSYDNPMTYEYLKSNLWQSYDRC